jgi:3-methyladenine DNA glycosylase AlkD
VSWALRSVGRRNAVLHARTLALATRLAASDEPAPRWIGKDTLRELVRAKSRT